LAIHEKLEGKDSLEFAEGLNYVAVALESEGKHQESESLQRQALAIFALHEQDCNKHSWVKSLANLGGILLHRGAVAEAEPLLMKAHALAQVHLGDDHPHTLMTLEWTASLANKKGNVTLAVSRFRRAAAEFARLLGKDHPETLRSERVLAKILSIAGEMTEAETLMRQGLDDCERLLGAEHPATLTSASNLAGLLEKKGDHAGAESLYRRAWATRERVLGPEHSDTLEAMSALVDLLAKKRPGHEVELRREYLQRVADHETTLDPLMLRRAALECYRSGDYPRAEKLYRRILHAGFEVGETHVHLARVLMMIDRDQEARAEVDFALQYAGGAKPHFAQRVTYFQVLFGLLDGEVPTRALRVLKDELNRPEAIMEWDIKALLEHVRPRLTSDAYELLDAISAAINDRTAMDRLNLLPLWAN
jgi:tetratricopeptide (TPR) repeat protein